MTQKEISKKAHEYNYQQVNKFFYDLQTGIFVFNAFVAGANCTNVEITTDFVWCVYNFLEDYKGGGFGFVTTQEALDKHFTRYWEKYKTKEEYDAFVEFPSNRIRKEV